MESYSANADAAKRLAGDAGIAIGPILFIIAILGILAAAIAAGSGSFTASTSSEGNKTKAATLIEIGQNIKIGFDRIIGTANATFDSSSDTVNIDPNDTTATTDLFSPTGGGVVAPSVTLANDPTTDTWLYPLIAIPKLGTTAGNRLAMLKVSSAVCTEINSKANGIATPAVADLDDFTAATLNPATNWPAAMDGKMVGCVQNNDAASTGYYFYQVLGVR